MRFLNRQSAGEALVEPIQRQLQPDEDAIVLALPRGGVVAAAPVAQALQLPLDVLIVRKLGLPQQPELAMGALARGRVVLNREVIDAAGVPHSEIQRVIALEQRELRRREALYRNGTPRLDLAQRTVILIDDGIATGSTVLSAIRAVRASGPRRIILATPVASRPALESVRPEVDAIVCLAVPEPFYGVGDWYDDFAQISDRDVIRLITESNEKTAGQPA